MSVKYNDKVLERVAEAGEELDAVANCGNGGDLIDALPNFMRTPDLWQAVKKRHIREMMSAAVIHGPDWVLEAVNAVAPYGQFLGEVTEDHIQVAGTQMTKAPSLTNVTMMAQIAGGIKSQLGLAKTLVPFITAMGRQINEIEEEKVRVEFYKTLRPGFQGSPLFQAALKAVDTPETSSGGGAAGRPGKSPLSMRLGMLEA